MSEEVLNQEQSNQENLENLKKEAVGSPENKSSDSKSNKSDSKKVEKTNEKVGLDEIKNLQDLLDKYKVIEEKLNIKQKPGEVLNNKEPPVDFQKSNLDLGTTIESLKNEISEIKSYLLSLKEGNNEMSDTKKESTQQKVTENNPEVLEKLKEIENLKKEILELKNSKTNEDLQKKLEDIESFKEKLLKEKIESLSIRRDELLKKYNLEDFAEFIPDPFKDSSVTEKDIVQAIINLYNKDIVKTGLNEFKKKKDILEKKENTLDIDNINSESELIKIRNKLLKKMGTTY